MRNLYLLLLLPVLAIPRAAAETPSANSFNVSSLDRKADPCEDFYQFACGGWLSKNPIPADQSDWGRFHELAERNRALLRGILEKASDASAQRSGDDRKLGDYYASCMDEKAADALGVSPLRQDLADIAAMKDSRDVSAEIARLFSKGVSSIFHFGSTQDFKDATSVIAEVDQGGLGLPDKDYYLRTDAASAELRAKYLDHAKKVFALAGYDEAASSAAAAAVMRFEKGLAEISMDKVDRRNPEKTYHKMSAPEFFALAPDMDWTGFFSAVGAPEIKTINAASPEFLKRACALIKTADLQDWKTFLSWRLLNSRAEMLSKDFVDEDFNFYGKTLSGAKELRPRWKRCADYSDDALGDLLGKRFVEQAFSPKAKASALEMVRNLETALALDIDNQDWMAAKTRGLAKVKLAAIENKIGYPDKWRDYSKLEVTRGDWLGDYTRARVFESRRQLAKIGKPLDRTDWDMSPPTVNAYYDPAMNNINFPAGILQPPFFDADLDPAVNYGAIGGVIGHEMTHGFDDEGRKFDDKGNMNDWWTAEDAKEYETRSECFVKEYSSFTVAGGVPVNGKLTLGENTADNGGLRLALMALNDSSVAKPEKPIDGFTQEQRLFLGWAQVWCTNYTDASLRLQVLSDPHSPAINRVNGVMSNMPEFSGAFSCHKGQKMVSDKPCRLW